MPFIPPMLCSRLERLERLTERRYIAEPKLDGQRAQEHVSERRIVACCSVDFEGYGDSGPML
jgi:ATP-dependent DNA ligase